MGNNNYRSEMIQVVNLTKCWNKLEEIGFNSYQNRQLKFISENILTKIRMLKDDVEDGRVTKTVEEKLREYKETHDGKDFPADISMSTLESIARLCQCQPTELFDWVEIELDPHDSYQYRVENKIKSENKRVNK